MPFIAFAAGEYVGYFEQFSVGAAGDGFYICSLAIAAPGFELRIGGQPARLRLPGGASQLSVPNKLARPGFSQNIQDVTALPKLW